MGSNLFATFGRDEHPSTSYLGVQQDTRVLTHSHMASGFIFGIPARVDGTLGRQADGARPVEALDHVNQARRSCWFMLVPILLYLLVGFTFVADADVVLQELARFRELGSRIGEAWRLRHCRNDRSICSC